MDNKGKAVSKADEGKTVVKEENKSVDEEILDDELEHVLCRLFYPTKMRKVFLQQDVRVWDEFMSCNKQEFQTYGFSPHTIKDASSASSIYCRSYS